MVSVQRSSSIEITSPFFNPADSAALPAKTFVITTPPPGALSTAIPQRSEERRVGKGCCSRWAADLHQAEDGIRDRDVTGVQTCALPISSSAGTPAAAW